MSTQDELTTTACRAVVRLSPIKKAQFLLNTALALIEDGVYGKEVKTYLDISLKTPGLPKEDVKRALLAQYNAQELAEGRLQPDPSTVSGQVQSQPPCKEIHLSIDPACQRIPPEIWDQIGAVMPRYHLRKWLFISRLHRDIACRYLFHTIHLEFPEYTIYDRELDILDRAINDPVFAYRVKSLRLHVECEEGDTSDLIFRMLTMSFRAFKALRNFEWIGNLEMPDEMVQILTHKSLHELGLKGWHFDEDTISAFHGLRKFGSHWDNSCEPEEEIRAVLDVNESTLRHLILDGCDFSEDSLDSVFESVTINNLTHLDLSSTIPIPGFVLGRISKAENLQSLTLCGAFEEPDYASQMFATCDIGLRHLESFRLDTEGDEDLCYSVISFLGICEKLRRLDLINCPWHVAQEVLPKLKNLRVLSVDMDEVSEEQIEYLVKALPTQMIALKLSADDSDIPLDKYASYFTRFYALSFLHLELTSYPVNPTPMSGANDFQTQIDKFLRGFAAAVPSLDFLIWHDTCYVVVRSHDNMGPTVELKKLLTESRLEYGSGVNVISEDIAWLQQKIHQWNSVLE